MKIKRKEVDLAVECIEYLKHKFPECEIYQEVPVDGSVVDIVCVNDGKFIGIECKLNLSLELLHQGDSNLENFHQSYICVPEAKHSKGKWFAEKVCKILNIGLIEITAMNGGKTLHIPDETDPIRLPTLFEEQKNWKQAGANRGVYFSVFQNTVILL